MKPILLYKSGEITPHGDPILCHFGPGSTIEPHPRAPTTKTLIRIGGEKFTVRGSWKDIAERAGYGDIISAIEKPKKKRAEKDTETDEGDTMDGKSPEEQPSEPADSTETSGTSEGSGETMPFNM